MPRPDGGKNGFVTSVDLDSWISVVTGKVPQPSDDFIVIAFPTETIREEYLSGVSDRAESEVRKILECMLGRSRSIPDWDALQIQITKAMLPADMDESEPADDSLGSRPQFTDYQKRAILAAAGKSSEPTWPGLTWVLDLLPGHPERALAVVSAYLYAHFEVLPDLRITGLSDAAAIIRSRYILGEAAAHENTLRAIGWRDFEFLIAALYEAKGYEVEVTPEQKDEGRDVIARRTGADADTLYIACSRGASKKTAHDVSALYGRLDGIERASRGIFVNVAGFTERGPGTAVKVAKELRRITLIGRDELLTQLNEHLGTDWPHRVDMIVAAARRHQDTPGTSFPS